MTIKVYAYTDYESMYCRRSHAGLSDEAADYFAHFEEIPLILEVDETGLVTECKLDAEWVQLFDNIKKGDSHG